MQNSYRKDVLNNYNQISQKEEKKTNNDFINIKKLCINSKNALTKITNQTNNIELKDKFNLLRKRHNKLNKLNNIIRINNNVKNVFNINNNEINNINNNSNINIYLSINMFNKMLNNHFNSNGKKKNFNERNPIQDLLYKQKNLMKIENKKKSLDNRFNNGYQNNYIYKNINAFKKDNKLGRSNSVGILINKNLNFGKNNFIKKNVPSIINYNFPKNKNNNLNFFNI
jgi:hypothetical protein